jgi:tetratricopeptide (TPR) repeat protein
MFRSSGRVSAPLGLWLWTALAAVSLFAANGKTDEAVRLFEARQFAQARPLLEAAVREDPSDARAAFYLGRAMLSADEVDGAVEWIEKAVSLDGSRVDYHLWLGRAYGAKAMRASVFQQPSLAGKVRREFERASALDPDNLEARFGLIEFYLRAPGVMGGSLAKAQEQAAQIARLDALQGHRAVGRVAEHEKWYDAARQEYSAALRDFPDNPEPYFWIGSFYERRKDFDRAFQVYEKLLEKRPDDKTVCYAIGKTAALSGERLDRGVECLKLYLSHTPAPEEPSLAWAHYRLGTLYEKKDSKDLAKAEYAAAISLDPTLKDARKALAAVR